MYVPVCEALQRMGLEGNVDLMGNAATILLLTILCLLLRQVTKKSLYGVFQRMRRQGGGAWDEIIIRRRVFEKTSNLVVPLIVSACYGNGNAGVRALVMRVAGLMGILASVLLFDSLLQSFDEIYQLYEISKIKPIRGFLQVIRVALYLLGGVIGSAILLGKSPMALIGGIGAMTAVTSFIFKDAILGFVAGIQLTANDMVRIGDWIELPRYFADGTVIDLSMTTVKIENFDKTITSLPAYVLVSEAFINWRGMEDCGGRRIKRSIYLDPADVKECGGDGPDGVKTTNLGLFRAYVTNYLKTHPAIRQDMPLVVRQLAPDGMGLPLEVYAFVGTTKWNDYEDVQSEFFEHLYAVVPTFGLRVYRKGGALDKMESI